MEGRENSPQDRPPREHFEEAFLDLEPNWLRIGGPYELARQARSRYTVGWQVSRSLRSDLALAALESR